MKLAANVKPVGYLKENADEIVRTLSERGGPLIITRDGEAKAVGPRKPSRFSRFSPWGGSKSKKDGYARQQR